MKQPNAIELILALHLADGTPPISTLSGLWERKLDERWTIWINGHMEDRPLRPEGEFKIHPGDCYVEYNGWPAGCFSIITGEGMIAGGSKANYRSFCAALKAATKTPKIDGLPLNREGPQA